VSAQQAAERRFAGAGAERLQRSRECRPRIGVVFDVENEWRVGRR
jgi:hypothetical protein